MEIGNSIVAENSATDTAPDLLGSFAADYSLILNPGSASIVETVPGSNIFGEAPLLGPLQDNGGPTETHALLPVSPAVDAGDPAFSAPPEFDQRGEGFPRVLGGRIDMGAYEATVESARYLGLASLPDSNGNHTPELAALRTLPEGTPQVIVEDSATNRPVRELTIINYEGVPIGLTHLGDINGNGYPEIAVLFRKPNGQGQVKVKDVKTDQWVNGMTFFWPGWQVLGITSQDFNQDGVPEISVIATKNDGTNTATQIKDSITGKQLNWIGFPLEH